MTNHNDHLKANCEICDQSLEQDSEAYICVYECTFCAPCTEERHNDHLKANCEKCFGLCCVALP
ncbi:DUF1272 domain-containing protein, partial [Bacillus sp. D-CC]